MTTHNLRTLLWLTAGLLAGGAVWVLAWGLVPPRPGQVTANDRSASTTQRAATVRPAVPPLEAFEAIFATGWAGDPKPPATMMTAPEPPPVMTPSPTSSLSLAGTIGSELAWFRDDAGGLLVGQVGEYINGYKILAIEPGRARVEIDGQEQVLEKPEPPTVLDRG